MMEIDELISLARAAQEAGDNLLARGYWRRASRVAPDRVEVWRGLYAVTGRPAERLRCLERIVALDPGDKEARDELAGLRAAEESMADVEETVEQDSDGADGPLYCVNHPGRETSLRCSVCGAPICTRCAVHTPVGIKCRACIRAQQAVFYTARWYDYPLAGGLAVFLSVPAAVIAGMAGWWPSLFIGPLVGGMIGWLTWRAVGRRRGRWLWLTVGGGVLVGAVIALFITGDWLSTGLYAAVAVGAAAGVLRPGRPR